MSFSSSQNKFSSHFISNLALSAMSSNAGNSDHECKGDDNGKQQIQQ